MGMDDEPMIEDCVSIVGVPTASGDERQEVAKSNIRARIIRISVVISIRQVVRRIA